MRSAGLATILVSASVLCGCGERADREVSASQVRDSAGISIVDNGPLELGRELLVSPNPTVEIGVVDGAAEYQFFQVSDAKRLPDGGFAVANGGSRELRIYRPDGSHRRTVGGPGQGPSEFGYPVAVRVLGSDTILVQDRSDRVYFSSDGDFLGRVTTERQTLMELNERIGGRSEGGYWMADGTFFTQVYERDEGPPVVGPPFRPRMTFVRVSADFGVVDTLGVYGGIQQQYVDVGEPRPSANVPPFWRNTTWGVGSAEGTIVAADNAVPQIELHSPDGSRTIARWTGDAVPVTRADVEAWKDVNRGMSWARERLPELERAWLALEIPETKPYFSRVTSGSDGRAWLGPADEGGEGWLVIGPDGRYVGTAGLPAGFVPMDSGPGWVLGVARDENDVEFLRLYNLIER